MRFQVCVVVVGSFEFSTVFIWFACYYKTFVFYASSFLFMMLSMAITMIFLYLMNSKRETEKEISSIRCSRRNVFIWKASLNRTEIYFTTIIFGLFTEKQNLFFFSWKFFGIKKHTCNSNKPNNFDAFLQKMSTLILIMMTYCFSCMWYSERSFKKRLSFSAKVVDHSLNLFQQKKKNKLFYAYNFQQHNNKE